MIGLLVIPARWGSTRFPGKPLTPVAGRPLLSRTIDLARRSMRGVAEVELVVATDDARIEALALAEDCAVVRTGPGIGSGSARALAAARARPERPGFVVNLQGDAPFMPPAAIAAVVAALSKGAAVATPVMRLDWNALDALRRHKRDTPFSGTTCIVAPDGRARWFSKAVIPAIRDELALREATPRSPVRRHLGLYGYTLEALARFDAAPEGEYERIEGLEQLRLIELGIPITAVEIDADGGADTVTMGGIDTPADVAMAERLIAATGDPYGT